MRGIFSCPTSAKATRPNRAASFWSSAPPSRRCLHGTTSKPAIPLPTTTPGPPPQPPIPATSRYGDRVQRRNKQAELLKRGQDLRASQMKPGTAMKKRFWKDVSVKETPGMTISLPTHTLSQIAALNVVLQKASTYFLTSGWSGHRRRPSYPSLFLNLTWLLR